MKVKKTLFSIIRNLIAWIFSAICLLPLLLILFNALKDKKAASKMDLFLPGFPIQWSNFATVIEKGKLATSFLNSLIYSAGSVVLCVLFEYRFLIGNAVAFAVNHIILRKSAI